jgi:hypothetical protein
MSFILFLIVSVFLFINYDVQKYEYIMFNH